MSAYRRPAGRAWQQFRAYAFSVLGNQCHLCHHGNAWQLDHVVSVLEAPELAWSISNVKPAHGNGRFRCQTCGRACNQSRRQGPKRPSQDSGYVQPELTPVSRLPRRGERAAGRRLQERQPADVQPAAPRMPSPSRDW